MKKLMTTIAVVLSTVAMMAQNPVIQFERTEHDFGKINEADGRVTTIFKFENQGMSPLVLNNVRASCGCTTPKWTKEPIEPGQSGEITVTYNPNGRPGRFQKTITVTSNASEGTKKLYIKGEVIPKSAQPVNNYPFKRGELSLKTNSIEFGKVKKDSERQSRELEYANQAKDELTVDVLAATANPELACQASLTTVRKGEAGKFIVALDPKVAKQYGPYEAVLRVVVDGQNYELIVHADIIEDFDGMSIEERQQAPILSVPAQIDLGQFVKGKTVKGQLTLANNGVNPLMIRRLYSEENQVKLGHKSSVKSGKKVVIPVTIPTNNQEVGTYKVQVVVITNDPQNPRQRVNVSYTIVE